MYQNLFLYYNCLNLSCLPTNCFQIEFSNTEEINYWFPFSRYLKKVQNNVLNKKYAQTHVKTKLTWKDCEMLNRKNDANLGGILCMKV